MECLNWVLRWEEIGGNLYTYNGQVHLNENWTKEGRKIWNIAGDGFFVGLGFKMGRDRDRYTVVVEV